MLSVICLLIILVLQADQWDYLLENNRHTLLYEYLKFQQVQFKKI